MQETLALATSASETKASETSAAETSGLEASERGASAQEVSALDAPAREMTAPEIPAREASGRELSAKGFPRHADTFSAYRDRTRAYLADRAMPSRALADIEQNLPFERLASRDVTYRGRFLLFHGLNDSPAVWHDFADALVARGYDVRAILFEGHGSSPVDMLDVEWESWLASARSWLEDWLHADDPPPIFLGGFSMGGVIATLLALDYPEVDGLLLVSPAYRSSLDRWLRFSGIYKHFRPWVFGGMILEDNPIKYNSIPVNSGWQFHQLTRELDRRWRAEDELDVPALLVMSSEDSVVDTDYTRRLFRKRFTHPDRHMLTFAPDVGDADSPAVGHTLSELRDLTESHEEVRNSRHDELRVLGQSHLSLSNAPDNALFGRTGRVRVCNGNEYPVFMACMRAREHWYGAQHTPSPDERPVARMTWNPDWEHVLKRFDEVFSENGKGSRSSSR